MTEFTNEAELKTDGIVGDLVGKNEVRPAPRQRRYSRSYKLRILAEADRCSAPGELASLIRREGIYSSTISDFRKQKARGELDGASKSLVVKGSPASADLERKLLAAERENRKLRRELEQSRLVIELQKKVAELLGVQEDD